MVYKKLIQIKKILPLLFLIFLSSCTTIGFHDDKVRNSMNFGEEQNLNVCVFYEDTLDLSDVKELERDWKDELALYKIKLEFTKTKKVERFDFFGNGVLGQLRDYKVSPDCHRLVYMVGRTWGDIAFEVLTLGIFIGVGVKLEVHGAVETRTNTRGYVKAKYVEFLQMLFTSPSSTLVHEGYHLLGCPHNLWKDECYNIILDAKKRNPNYTGKDKIFPVRSIYSQEFYQSSKQVNSLWGSEKEFLEDNVEMSLR